jgi:hypothetical protein
MNNQGRSLKYCFYAWFGFRHWFEEFHYILCILKTSLIINQIVKNCLIWW